MEVSQQANAQIQQQKLQYKNQTNDRLIKDIDQQLNAQLQIRSQSETEQQKADNQRQIEGVSLEEISSVNEFEDIYVGDYNGKIDNMEVSDLYDFGKYREDDVQGELWFNVMNYSKHKKNINIFTKL